MFALVVFRRIYIYYINTRNIDFYYVFCFHINCSTTVGIFVRFCFTKGYLLFLISIKYKTILINAFNLRESNVILDFC